LGISLTPARIGNAQDGSLESGPSARLARAHAFYERHGWAPYARRTAAALADPDREANATA
jgi:hypothetical protein